MKKSIVVLIMCFYSIMSFGLNNSITAVGHICVEIVDPASIKTVQNLQFEDDKVKMASAKIDGSSTYSVTLSNNGMNFTQNGKTYSIDNFTTTSDNNQIYVGGAMKIGETLSSTDNITPLLVTVNYN